MSNIKSTFGASVSQPSENKDFREEAGAIWNRTTKNNTNFMSIQLKLSKQKLQELLNNNQEEIVLKYVAFSNKNKGQVTSRPDFRIFEERK